MVCFNHSTQRQMLDYLCIQPEDVKEVYENAVSAEVINNVQARAKLVQDPIR